MKNGQLISPAILKMKCCLIIVVFLFSLPRLEASPQVPDVLVFRGDTIYLFSNPLEDYLKSKGIGDDDRGCSSSACWRGYVATWAIRNDSLFLVNVRRCGNYVVAGVVTGLECSESDTSKVMKFVVNEFGDKETFARWYSGELISPQGRILQYVHMGYLSTYESEVRFKIENGILKDIDKKTIPFPDPGLLDQFNHELIQDTLFHYIAKGLDWKKVGGEMICDGWYKVKFTRTGRVKKFKYDREPDVSKWKSFWWNLSISDCRRTLKRPVSKLNFKKMLVHGGQVPRKVKFEIFYWADSNTLTLEK